MPQMPTNIAVSNAPTHCQTQSQTWCAAGSAQVGKPEEAIVELCR
jgi:hypothetical protein